MEVNETKKVSITEEERRNKIDVFNNYGFEHNIDKCDNNESAPKRNDDNRDGNNGGFRQSMKVDNVTKTYHNFATQSRRA